MKKIIFILTVILLCGCSLNSKDEYEGYERYELKSSSLVSYTFNLGYNNNVTYALGEINFGEGYNTGLYYKIDENEYILLDEANSCNEADAHKSSSSNVFVNNKLYLVRCLGASIVEYTLNGLEIEKKELKFDETKVLEDIEDDGHPHYLETHSIEKVDGSYIYFKATIHNGPSGVQVKCSLTDYICEKY